MKANIGQYNIELAWLRWEFMRICPEYMKDYRDLQEGKFKRGIELFCFKWSLFIPLDPEYSFDDMEHECRKLFDDKEVIGAYLYYIIIGFGLSEIYPPISDSQNYIPETNVLIPRIDYTNGLIDYAVTINLYYEKKVILKEFEKIVDNLQDELKKHKDAQLKKVDKMRARYGRKKIDQGDPEEFIKNHLLFPYRRIQDTKTYEKYLETYYAVKELKESGENWTWRDVAKVVFPNDFVDEFEMAKENDENMKLPNPESAEKKVQQYYEEYIPEIWEALARQKPLGKKKSK